MTENRRQILDMLSTGKISVEEAESLLGLLEQPASVATSGSDTGEGRKSPPKYYAWWWTKTGSQRTSG